MSAHDQPDINAAIRAANILAEEARRLAVAIEQIEEIVNDQQVRDSLTVARVRAVIRRLRE